MVRGLHNGDVHSLVTENEIIGHDLIEANLNQSSVGKGEIDVVTL